MLLCRIHLPGQGARLALAKGGQVCELASLSEEARASLAELGLMGRSRAIARTAPQQGRQRDGSGSVSREPNPAILTTELWGRTRQRTAVCRGPGVGSASRLGYHYHEEQGGQEGGIHGRAG